MLLQTNKSNQIDLPYPLIIESLCIILMGSLASLPIVVHNSPLVQAISGDLETAKAHQQYFINGCPIALSAQGGITINGVGIDESRISEAQSKAKIGSMIKGIPAIGHIKGSISYAIKDTPQGDKQIKDSKRSVPVIGSVAAAFYFGGPVAAFATDFKGNISQQKIIGGIGSAVHHQYLPYGEIAVLTNMIHGHYETGTTFDFSASIGRNQLCTSEDNEKNISNSLLKDPKLLTKLYRIVKTKQSYKEETLNKQNIWLYPNLQYQKAQIQANCEWEKQNNLFIEIEKQTYQRMKYEEQQKEKAITEELSDLSRNLEWPQEDPFIGNGTAANRLKVVGDTNLLLLQNPLNHIKRLMAQVQSLNEVQVGKVSAKLAAIENIIQNNSIRTFFTKYAPQYLQSYDNILKVEDKQNRSIQFVQYLQQRLMQLRQQLNNFSHFNRHIHNISALDLLEFRYQRVGKALQLIGKKNQFAGAIINQFIPKSLLCQTNIEQSGQFTRVEKAYNDLSDYELADQTTIIYIVKNMVINNRQISPVKLIDHIYGGGLPIQSIKISVSARDTTLSKSESKIILRYWRKGFTQHYKDVELTKSCIAKYWRTFQYQSTTDPLDYLDSGGVIDIFGILGNSEDSQIIIKDLVCQVKYGSLELSIGKINTINSLMTYSCPKASSRQATDDLIPLINNRFECGNRVISKIKISYRAKDQGWGNRKGGVYLRIWHPDNTNYDQVALYDSIYHHWKTYNYEDSVNIKQVPINSALQFYCRVGGGGGHQLFVEDLEMRVQLKNVQSEQYNDQVQKIYQKNQIKFSMQQEVRHDDMTDELIPLYDQFFQCKDRKFQKIRVTFCAQDQGWGNRKGRVFYRVWQPDREGHQDVDITHEDVPHQLKEYAYQDDTNIRNLPLGSKLQFYCRVGGGGGHSIAVQDFQAILQLQPLIQDQYLQKPKKVTSLITYFPLEQISSNDANDQLLPLFKEIISCGDKILERVSISFVAKIQNATDEKYQILLKVQNCNKQIQEIKINGRLTPNWKDYTFEDTNLIRMVQSNSTIQVCCRVGQNELLSIKNFQMTLYQGKKHFSFEKNSTFHFKEEMKDLPRTSKHEVLLKNRFIVEKEISKIYIEYQACGRGQVFMTIFNRRTGKLIHVNISKGETYGEYKKYIYEWSRNREDQLPQIGDAIQLNYKTQDTKFSIRNVYYSIEHQDTQIVFNSHYHFTSNLPAEGLIPIYENKINCRLNEVKKVKVTFVGKDKGEGKVYMRITQPNGLIEDVNISNGPLSPQYREVHFQSEQLSSRIPPGSILQFFCFVGKQIHINDFQAEITIGNSPRPEKVIFNQGQWSNSRFSIISKLKEIKIELIPIQQSIQSIYLNVFKPDGKTLRNTIKITQQDLVQNNGKYGWTMDKQTLDSKVAIGDIIELSKEGPIDRSNCKKIQALISFSPLSVPNHRVLTFEFTDAHWTEQNGKQLINVVGKEHSLKFASKIVALSASCSWKDSGKNQSTGKLYLIQKDSLGKVKNKIDIFGTVTHNWCNVMARFDSESDFVRASEENDEISLQRETGSNGQLFVDDLQMVMITNGPK